ncbi:hypothetical protein EYF80_014231 [Liparis tanakae]|uniref:Uncharacterized protein n=1 Tax=Liparis tanakae TaxID=230148 RepID=A0A4Z2IBJ0_9TELE|nr:hypothetical protein EYF80_014231 [Liparis tanakae]
MQVVESDVMFVLTIRRLSGLFTTAATVSASGVRSDMEEIFKGSSSSSSSSSLWPRALSNRSLITAELMDWSTFISISLTSSSSSSEVPSVVFSTAATTTLRGLDVEVGGDAINTGSETWEALSLSCTSLVFVVTDDGVTVGVLDWAAPPAGEHWLVLQQWPFLEGQRLQQRWAWHGGLASGGWRGDP